MDCIAAAVAAHHLHESWPVPIRRLLLRLGWSIYEVPLGADVRALAVKTKDTKYVLVREGLSDEENQAALAHEWAHELMGDLDFETVQLAHTDPRQESRVWRSAVQILIPPAAVRRYQTISAIAAACMVPEELLWRHQDVLREAINVAQTASGMLGA